MHNRNHNTAYNFKFCDCVKVWMGLNWVPKITQTHCDWFLSRHEKREDCQKKKRSLLYFVLLFLAVFVWICVGPCIASFLCSYLSQHNSHASYWKFLYLLLLSWNIIQPLLSSPLWQSFPTVMHPNLLQFHMKTWKHYISMEISGAVTISRKLLTRVINMQAHTDRKSGYNRWLAGM